MDKGTIDVTEIWPDNCILITNRGKEYILYNEPIDKSKAVFGTSKEGSIALSLNEAEELVEKLQYAISQYKALDYAYEADMEQREKDGET